VIRVNGDKLAGDVGGPLDDDATFSSKRYNNPLIISFSRYYNCMYSLSSSVTGGASHSSSDVSSKE
jgi:hypothetical protein